MPRKDKIVSVNQAAQPGKESAHVLLGDLRTLSVDCSLRVRHNLHVDTAHPLFHIDKVILNTDTVKQTLNFCSCEPGCESQRGILKAEILQGDGHIHALSAGVRML